VNAADGDGRADIPALVAAAAGELLDRAETTLDDDFFSAGGDSMLAMHLVGRLSRATGLRVRVSQLFAAPVLRDFAAGIEQLREAELTGADGAAAPLAAAAGPGAADGGAAGAL
jgi:aryl carrier-like protein